MLQTKKNSVFAKIKSNNIGNILHLYFENGICKNGVSKKLVFKFKNNNFRVSDIIYV